MKSGVGLIAKAEAVLDRTLAYQAAQTVHELKATLGIDIQQINLAIRPVPNDAGTYRVVCTILCRRAATAGTPTNSADAGGRRGQQRRASYLKRADRTPL
jgi:hypothetical protein